jgi:hypothetical protein
MRAATTEVTLVTGTLRIEQHLAEMPGPTWPWIQYVPVGTPRYYLNDELISEDDYREIVRAAMQAQD